jgi:hypothetical protein
MGVDPLLAASDREDQAPLGDRRRILDGAIKTSRDPERVDSEVQMPWFSKIERDLIARGIFTSKGDLACNITRYIKHHNVALKPIRWMYSNPERRIRGISSTVTVHLGVLETNRSLGCRGRLLAGRERASMCGWRDLNF